MDELYETVEKMLLSGITFGEVIKKMSDLGYSRDKIIAAIKSYFKPQETQVDMLRYRTHKMGYMLCFLAIICDCVGFAFIYSTITAVDVFNGLDIIFNILFMLFTFLVAEQVKVYNVKASYAALVLGGLEIGHLFWYPTVLFAAGNLSNSVYVLNVICMITAGASLIIAGIANLFRGTILHNYLNALAQTDESAKLELQHKEEK